MNVIAKGLPVDLGTRSLAQHIALHLGIGVEIERNYDIYNNGYVLKWTDFVANEWREEYGTLAQVLLRLAVLVQCGENDWEMGFTESEPSEFYETASRFFAEQVA